MYSVFQFFLHSRLQTWIQSSYEGFELYTFCLLHKNLWFYICFKSNVRRSTVNVSLCKWTWPGPWPHLQFKTSRLLVDLLSCRPFLAPPLDLYFFERKWWMTESHILTPDLWPSGLCRGSFRWAVEWVMFCCGNVPHLLNELLLRTSRCWKPSLWKQSSGDPSEWWI